MNKKFRFLDLSGYIVSGKQALSDLLREFKGYQVPRFDFEFELIRIQGGIRDLETALVDDWSPLRADSAIRRFRQVVRRFGTVNKYTDIKTWFTAVGWGYNKVYQGRFFELSENFINRIVKATWRTNWPFPLVETCDHELFLRKLGRQLFFKSTMDFDISLSAPSSDEFLEAVNDYLSNLLTTGVSDDIQTIVTHNAFEPFNPSRAIRYLPDARCIIVDRDPRDSYMAMLPHRHLALSVDDFIQRFGTYRQIVTKYTDLPGRVLRIRYEDLLFSYEQTVKNVLNFLHEPPATHVSPLKHFNPANSIQYAGIWKKHTRQDEISEINLKLRDYCDPRID